VLSGSDLCVLGLNWVEGLAAGLEPESLAAAVMETFPHVMAEVSGTQETISHFCFHKEKLLAHLFSCLHFILLPLKLVAISIRHNQGFLTACAPMAEASRKARNCITED
jgi:hypothetical protein